MNKKIIYLIALLLIPIKMSALNVESNKTNDENTVEDKCPTQVTIKDDVNFEALEKIFNDDNTIDYEQLSKFFSDNTKEDIINASSGADTVMVGGKYCPIYCVEENAFNFPGYAPIVDTGNHFTWTLGKNDENNVLSGLTVKLTGVKVCTATVDLNAWIKDYIEILHKIENYPLKTSSYQSSNCTPDAGAECAYVPSKHADQTFSTTTTVLDSLKSSGIEAQDKWQKMYQDVFGFDEDYRLNRSNLYYYLVGNFQMRDASIGTFNNLSNYAITQANNGNGNVIENVYTTGSSLDLPKAQYFNSILTTTGNVYEYKRSCCTWVFDKVLSKLYTETERTKLNYGIEEAKNDPNTTNYLKKGIETKQYVYYDDEGPYEDTVYEFNGKYYTSQKIEYASCPSGTYATSIESKCINPRDGSLINRDSYVVGSGTELRREARYSWILYKRLCTSGSQTSKGEDTVEPYQEILANQGGHCVYGARTCPSGYSLGSDNMCYKNDVSDLIILLQRLRGMIEELKGCKEKLKNFDYKLDTKMNIEYNETDDGPKYYKTNSNVFPNNGTISNLTVDNELKGSSDVFTGEAKSITSSIIWLYGNQYNISQYSVPFIICNVYSSQKYCNPFILTELNDYWYDFYGKVYYTKYNYKLNNNFYRYTLQPRGISQSTLPTGNYFKYSNYLNTGYPNYPVHYNTKFGNYEGLNIAIKNIGYNNELYRKYKDQINKYNNSLSDPYINAEGRIDSLLHDCYYNVKEGSPFCPTKDCGGTDSNDLGGVRIIYRPISLVNPFPSIDGDGRSTGSNWCSENDCSNVNSTVSKYILNNRGVLYDGNDYDGKNIYTERKPMYQITLTPEIIKEIREYNKNTTYDDYNLSCNGGTVDSDKLGYECRSHFVVGGMEETNLPSLKEYFTETCGINSDFNLCDKLDNHQR